MSEPLIQDVLLILAAGALAGLVSRSLNISVLVGYLAVGALLGDGLLGWVSNEGHALEQVAEAGVFLLLFTIGLELSLEDLRRQGTMILLGGGAQMALVTLPVAATLTALGEPARVAWLVGLALSFSSTVLVFGGLSEQGQANSPAGRRAIGVLLFQDAALVPLLLIVPLLTGTSEGLGWVAFVLLGAKSILFLVAVFVIRFALGSWIIPRLTAYRSPQLVVLLTVIALGSMAFAAHRLGLPAAVGAFAAGFAFNGNRWTEQIDALMLPFRETFSAVFFVSLGLIFDPRVLIEEPLFIIGIMAAMWFLKTTAASLALWTTGLNWRRAIGMGLGLAHVGEFAFVVMLEAFESRGVSVDVYRRFVAISVCSLFATPFLLDWGLKFISREDSAEPGTDAALGATTTNAAIVVGAGPIGRRVASLLETSGRDVCVIDLSPVNLHPFAVAGFRTVAGDASHPPTLRHAGIEMAGIVVVAVPNDDQAVQIVRLVRLLHRDTTIVVRCRYQANQQRLREAGAHVVVSEETLAAESLAAILRSLD